MSPFAPYAAGLWFGATVASPWLAWAALWSAVCTGALR